MEFRFFGGPLDGQTREVFENDQYYRTRISDNAGGFTDVEYKFQDFALRIGEVFTWRVFVYGREGEKLANKALLEQFKATFGEPYRRKG